jgi:hypothetical protein
LVIISIIALTIFKYTQSNNKSNTINNNKNNDEQTNNTNNNNSNTTQKVIIDATENKSCSSGYTLNGDKCEK